MGMGYAIPLQKTHSIPFETRRVCYPWHRWYGRNVLTRKAGGMHADAAYFCRLPETPIDTMLVEMPRWMFDAAECSTMQLVEWPYVDCVTLLSLKNTIAEQSVSATGAVLQTQVSRQAGHGDTDGSDSTSKSNETAGAVRRTSRRTSLVRSNRIHPGRGGPASIAIAGQRSKRKSSSSSSDTRRTR